MKQIIGWVILIIIYFYYFWIDPYLTYKTKSEHPLCYVMYRHIGIAIGIALAFGIIWLLS